MSTRTSLGRTSIMVPLTISPAVKRTLLCLRASSIVSITVLLRAFCAGDLAGVVAPNEAPLPNGPDVAVTTEVGPETFGVECQVVRLYCVSQPLRTSAHAAFRRGKLRQAGGECKGKMFKKDG